jgi:hypothetical protein
MVACRQVLVRKQTGYGELISWLEAETRKLSAQRGVDVGVLVGVAKALPGRRQKGKLKGGS